MDEAEALSRILARVEPVPPRDVPLVAGLGRFSACEIVAPLSLPPFDNSAMDGYAVVVSAAGIGERLHVTGEQPAGTDRRLTVRPGEAVRIFTGAPLPLGTDAVIMQEDVTCEGNEIVVNTEAAVGEFIRRRGGDIAAGQKIVSTGDRIRPGTIALLAAQGLDSVEVGGEVTAAIISTGDELKPAGIPLEAGEIHDANGAMLHALLHQAGVQSVSAVRCADNAAEIESAIHAATSREVLIISGGVSVGARDFVKAALNSVGAELDLWRVAVKPGKPFLFGRAGRCAIFGLPGNPVSAFVTFQLFARPAILKMMGANDAALPLGISAARLRETLTNDGDRPHYIRGSIEGDEFEPNGRQESHAIFGLSRSNALLRLDPRSQRREGEMVRVLRLD